MKSLRTYSGRTLFFGFLVSGIVVFVIFVFVTVVFNLGERKYIVVRASDYTQTNRTNFVDTVATVPHLDSLSPDFQKKIDDTASTIDKIHKNFNFLEDVFDVYAHHIQDYTELQKSIHTQREENKKKMVRENTLKIAQGKKQIPILQKQISLIKKALSPASDEVVAHQKKVDLYASQLAILQKQMQTNIIIAQVKRVKNQIAEVRMDLGKAEENVQRLTAQQSDIVGQIDNINKNIPLLQAEIDAASTKDNTEEDKTNISATKKLISDITSLKDDLDDIKSDIYDLESHMSQMFSDLKNQNNGSSIKEKLESIIADISSTQKKMEDLGLRINDKNGQIQAAFFVLQLQ